jgi:hypothetical protein
MVDRISKIDPHGHPRVDEAKDSTDDEGQSQDTGDEEGFAQSDGFDRLIDKTNWQILLDQPRQNQKKLVMALSDLSEMRFLKINLKTNPSLLNVKVFLRDGMVYPSAYISIPRHRTVAFQHLRQNAVIDARDVTDDDKVTLFVPDLKTDFKDEVTRVTKPLQERTFSQTIKFLVKKTWIQKIGIQDPETRKTNTEIATAYLTVAVVILSLAFAVYWLMT